ncbi:MAG: zinc transporter ZupT [Syntrophobacterales bacterium]|nr:zinc transporter ZupT [Syntrophobacterales bacterium]
MPSITLKKRLSNSYMENLFVALGMTFFSGMATAIGSAIAFFATVTNYRFLSISTGFSAGAMLYVSFSELLPRSASYFVAQYGEISGRWFHLLAFFAGIALIGVIDIIVPSEENPHETRSETSFKALKVTCGEGEADKIISKNMVSRAGVFAAIAIGIHNFPEGLTTFFSTLENFQMGLTIALAVALHNIPEGITVSVPIFYATGRRWKAFIYSALTGLAEPVGALFFYVILNLILQDSALFSNVLGYILAMVAGIMVYVSVDELLPISRAYGKGHDSLVGFIIGMGITAVGLTILK